MLDKKKYDFFVCVKIIKKKHPIWRVLKVFVSEIKKKALINTSKWQL